MEEKEWGEDDTSEDEETQNYEEKKNSEGKDGTREEEREVVFGEWETRYQGAFFSCGFIEAGINKTGNVKDNGRNSVACKVEKTGNFLEISGIFNCQIDGGRGRKFVVEGGKIICLGVLKFKVASDKIFSELR